MRFAAPAWLCLAHIISKADRIPQPTFHKLHTNLELRKAAWVLYVQLRALPEDVEALIRGASP